MALSSAITTSRLTQAYQQSPLERISTRIYDFSSFFSPHRDWIDKNCTHFARPGKRIRVREFIRDKRDRWNIYIYIYEIVENSSKFEIFNGALIILYYSCREIIRERHTRRNLRLHLQKIRGLASTRRGLFIPMFFPLLVHVDVIYSVLPSAYSFARTFSVIISCLLRERCVTVNEMWRITCIRPPPTYIFIVSGST